MRVRYLGLAWVAALLLGAGAGCSKSTPSAPEAPRDAGAAPAPVEILARLHWLGKERVAADTNSTRLMQIWAEPESAFLEARTLDKLAAFPWRSVSTNAQATTSPRPLAQTALRALLQDVLLKESFLEIRQADTNHSPELTFAIRLEESRAAAWQTNLATVLESLTGTPPAPTPYGWELLPPTNAAPQPGLAASRMQLARAQGWTLLNLSNPGHSALTNFDSQLSSLLHPQSSNSAPDWLEANCDPTRLVTAFGLDCKLPEGFPAFSLAAFGDGENVRTRGELRFPNPLPPLLEPWTVPTNLIGRRLLGFTAARGTAPLFRRLPLFSKLEPQAIPNQVYVWDDLGAPFHLYFALAVPDSRALFNQVAIPLRDLVNPRVAFNTNYGAITVDTNAETLVWQNLYHATPFLEAVTNTQPQFLSGGFGPHEFSPTRLMPVELLDHLDTGTNLVYYDFEVTGQRLLHFRYLDDVYRILFDAHGPRLSRTPTIAWVSANLTNLSFAATELRQEDTHRLSLARKSTLGLTAPEIDWVANWLELPEFPCGFTTLLQTNGAPVLRHSRYWQLLHGQHPGTNAPPQKNG